MDFRLLDVCLANPHLNVNFHSATKCENSHLEGENIESSCVPKILTAKIKVHDFERYVLNFWIVACVQIGGENFLEFHFL